MFFASANFHNSTPIFKDENKNSTNLFNNDLNADALTVVSESFVAYNTKDSILKVGNFLLNTPLINKSSSRIVPWSYQGASFVLKDVLKSSIQLTYINKIREYTSHEYKKESRGVELDKGISIFGFKHHPIDPLDVHIYYYNAPSLYDSSFVQIDYKDTIADNRYLFCVGFQNIKTYDDYDADLIGFRTGLFADKWETTLNYTKNSGVDKANGYGGLSKVYTSSMIANGRGGNTTTWMLKTNIELDIVKKQSSEFSIWLANVKSNSNDYNSYYTHLKHDADNYTKIYLRYEYQDNKDDTKNAQYIRVITSYDF